MGLVKFRQKSLRSKVGRQAESTTFCHLPLAGLESGRELSLHFIRSRRDTALTCFAALRVLSRKRER
jgi:hypothetical protein